MKCDWMSPFVESPQMKKVAKSAQKAGLRGFAQDPEGAGDGTLPVRHRHLCGGLGRSRFRVFAIGREP